MKINRKEKLFTYLCLTAANGSVVFQGTSVTSFLTQFRSLEHHSHAQRAAVSHLQVVSAEKENKN